ncbi:MAG: porin [Polyangia bacterium]
MAFGRVVFSGNVFTEKLKYFVQIDGSTFGNNNGVTLLDWWMQYTFSPYFYVLAGRWLLPYSKQFLTHPGNLLLADISAADYAFDLPRGIGVQLGGTAGRLSYDVFLVNSVRALGLATQVNRTDSISAGARLELAILKPYGFTESKPVAPDQAELSVGLAVAWNPVADASGFQNLEAGDDTLNLTADLGFRWQRLSVQGAFYYRHLTNQSVDDSFGYFGQAGLYVVRKYVELAARVSGALLSSRSGVADLKNRADGSTTEYIGGLNLYLFGHGAKLQTDYSYVQSDRFGTALSPGISTAAHRIRIQTQLMF